MPRTTDAREKALETAEKLFRSQGYAATGLTQVLDASGAPKGSYYHHFPGGKAQMAEEALARYADRAEALIAHLAGVSKGDPSGFVRRLADAFGKEMKTSQWELGCMLQNFAAELAPSDEAWADRLAAIGTRWRKALAKPFVEAGLSAKDAAALATSLLAALTGARTQVRIARSTEPFERVAETFVKVLQAHRVAK